MTTLTRARFTPSREPLTAFGRMLDDDFFSSAANALFRSALQNQPTTQGWAPRVDIQETEKAYRLHADLPGLSKDDIDLTFEDGVLTISGERTFAHEEDKDTFRRFERAFGSFSRAFSLPSEVVAENISANFKDGVLTIEVPKAEKVLPKKIKVS